MLCTLCSQDLTASNFPTSMTMLASLHRNDLLTKDVILGVVGMASIPSDVQHEPPGMTSLSVCQSSR